MTVIRNIQRVRALTYMLLIATCLITCQQQVKAQYQTVIDYFPQQREGVADEQYRRATHILTKTYAAIERDSFQIAYADHINIATAYRILKEPQYKILEELRLAQEEDIEATAELFLMAFKEPADFNLTQQQFDSLTAKFTTVMANKKEKVFDLEAYAAKGNFNRELLLLIHTLNIKDQQHRGMNPDMHLQQMIDAENIKVIDSLYVMHKKYIGRSMVGEKFESTMWAVIQHSDLAQQEKYLPVVQEAVKQNELHETPFKMLIDRIYTEKYGYQIFGSQSSSPLASEDVIRQTKQMYNLQD